MDKDYFITIKGQRVPVTKEVYYAYYRPVWREMKHSPVRAFKEQSLDVLMEYGLDPVDPKPLAEEIVEDRMVLGTLLDSLSRLPSGENALIRALFYENKTERAAAKELGVAQKTVNKRKQQIIEKLRKIFFE